MTIKLIFFTKFKFYDKSAAAAVAVSLVRVQQHSVISRYCIGVLQTHTCTVNLSPSVNVWHCPGPVRINRLSFACPRYVVYNKRI